MEHTENMDLLKFGFELNFRHILSSYFIIHLKVLAFSVMRLRVD